MTNNTASEHEPEAPDVAGFGALDDKGRVSLPKAVRTSLGLRPGSSLAYVMLDHAVLLIPQDEHLARVQREASAALAEAGLTVEDLLERLPQARADVIREAYSDEFFAQLKAMRQGDADDQGEDRESVDQTHQTE